MVGSPKRALVRGQQVVNDEIDDASKVGFALDGESRRQMQALFDLLDKDKNGVLQLADWPCTHVAVDHWEIVRQHLDLNGDKTITPEEFVWGLKRMVLRMPQNVYVLQSTPCIDMLHLALNESTKVVLRDLHESAVHSRVVQPLTAIKTPEPVVTAVQAEEGAGMPFGWVSQRRAANATVVALCRTVMYQIRETYRRNHVGLNFDNELFEDYFMPISYKMQVVAGKNYFVKAQLAHAKFEHTHLLVKIYKHSSKRPVLTAMKESGIFADSNEEFL